MLQKLHCVCFFCGFEYFFIIISFNFYTGFIIWLNAKSPTTSTLKMTIMSPARKITYSQRKYIYKCI